MNSTKTSPNFCQKAIFVNPNEGQCKKPNLKIRLWQSAHIAWHAQDDIRWQFPDIRRADIWLFLELDDVMFRTAALWTSFSFGVVAGRNTRHPHDERAMPATVIPLILSIHSTQIARQQSIFVKQFMGHLIKLLSSCLLNCACHKLTTPQSRLCLQTSGQRVDIETITLCVAFGFFWCTVVSRPWLLKCLESLAHGSLRLSLDLNLRALSRKIPLVFLEQPIKLQSDSGVLSSPLWVSHLSKLSIFSLHQ